jgi:hypothetical protein
MKGVRPCGHAAQASRPVTRGGVTVGADGDTPTDRRAERIAPGPAWRASDEPQPLRELLKSILDELNDKLESFEGEPTPADHRWLRGQLRKLVDRLDMP